ncbi:unknown protein [Microcystis aeruginosa NIES-843]|uniref:Uncharacterized protein n=1 Tax=Microcystis aeruginosa (strain NIES-843 / IAM M-2473) TaxID=449447 RepID=B0JJ50_MICAN|nr:unknown protein [Microcystis aeruginosa NIES-843]
MKEKRAKNQIYSDKITIFLLKSPFICCYCLLSPCIPVLTPMNPNWAIEINFLDCLLDRIGS